MEKGKVIDINRYKNDVSNSPLLSGDIVEVKDYSIGNKTNQLGTPVQATGTTTQQPPRIEVNKNFSFPYNGANNSNNIENQQASQNLGSEIGPEMPPPPQGDQFNDNIDPMQFGEQTGNDNPLSDEQTEVSKNAALQSSAMLINLYSSIVPPIIANTLKTNVMDFGTVLKSNSQIPASKTAEIQKFLLLKNEEIETALKLTREQTMLLKHALADVLKRYNLQPENPVVNLLIVIIGIGVSQFMAIRQIMAQQQEYLLNFIEQFSVTIPEGVSNPLLKKVRIQVKKRKEYSEAA
jgi:hypothetical protein